MNSVRVRVLLLLAIFGLTTAAALVVITYYSIRDYYVDVQYKRSNEFVERLIDMHPDMWAEYEKDAASFDAKLRSFILYAPKLGLYLLDNDGRVLASAGQQQAFWSDYRVDIDAVRNGLAQQNGRNDGQPIFADDPDIVGAKCLVTARPVGMNGTDKGWLYVVTRGADADTAPFAMLKTYAVRTGVQIGLITIAFGVLLTMAVMAMMTRPLAALTRVAERIKESGLESGAELAETEIPYCSRTDEIGKLGSAFREMLNRLRTEMKRVTQADAKRREMVASVSHDLRTPLTALTAQIETIMMKSCSMDEAQRQQFYGRALNNAEHLRRLTDSLAEVSRLDNPEFRAQPEPLAMGELADDVVHRFVSRAEAKGIQLTVDYPDGLPLAELDADLIERALANLIDNALRVTPAKGRVDVAVVPDARGLLRVQVRDTGPGVCADDQQRVFEAFFQASRHRETRGSSGLGLALVRMVAELHGGVAGLESEPGKGATFFMDLPFAGRSVSA